MFYKISSPMLTGRLHIVLSLCLAMALLSGCRAAQIESELKQLKTQRASSEKRLAEINGDISTVQTEIKQVEAAIRERGNATAAYMQEHVLAITCMAAVGYSVGEDNLFSDDVNKMINAGTFLCLAAAILSEDFRTEVAQVVGTLDEASTAVKNLQSQLPPLRSKLAVVLKSRSEEQQTLNEIVAKERTLQAELDRLNGT